VDDTELLERARAGDREALESLMERHQAQVFRFGMKMCRDPEDAKEVLQETLLALARGIRDFRGASSLSTWLFTVARSFCIKARRRDARRAQAGGAPLSTEETTQLESLADPAPGADEALATREIGGALERAIAALEPMYREVLLLRDVEGLSAKEVAEVVGISEQAVKSRLHRARLAVRDGVASFLGAPAEPAATSCPDVLAMFSQNLEGEISAETCARMQEHVAACPPCRERCDSLQKTLALCRASGERSSVPAAVQEQVRVALRAAG
jgi:RNA polymerase sigma-70 factor (ECF subfamily)